ncbi:hypothetical protein HNR30_000530 [Nonomuraea soli]|uniref:Uncharacterized protein n=1 Tax=Nonomuraea soli TaxID=1032476 RepID=A0A7W0HMW5_9ACTN|nr:hypothetical protein [Nonomuraea soli]
MRKNARTKAALAALTSDDRAIGITFLIKLRPNLAQISIW